MARFREEHYATKEHRAWVALQRRADPVDQTVIRKVRTWSEERRALRSEYFKKKQKEAKKKGAWPHAGQRRLDAWKNTVDRY